MTEKRKVRLKFDVRTGGEYGECLAIDAGTEAFVVGPAQGVESRGRHWLQLETTTGFVFWAFEEELEDA